MNRLTKELIPLMKQQFPDWADNNLDEETYGDVIEEAISLLGEVSIQKFINLGWQEQDEIINVLMAIRG